MSGNAAGGKTFFFFQIFVPVFTGRAKSFNVTKLKTSTFYRFRLIAVNELGQSLPSEVVTFSTQVPH